MAEIKVQRRSSNAVWWIVGVIALIVLLWMIFAWAGWDTGVNDVGSAAPAGRTIEPAGGMPAA
jgi:hypothetical protein